MYSSPKTVRARFNQSDFSLRPAQSFLFLIIDDDFFFFLLIRVAKICKAR